MTKTQLKKASDSMGAIVKKLETWQWRYQCNETDEEGQVDMAKSKLIKVWRNLRD